MLKSVFAAIILLPTLSFASLKLADNKLKAVVCHADDNQTVVINASRTKIKYTVEGESNGALPITKKSRSETSRVFSTSELTMIFTKKSVLIRFDGTREAYPWDCK